MVSLVAFQGNPFQDCCENTPVCWIVNQTVTHQCRRADAITAKVVATRLAIRIVMNSRLGEQLGRGGEVGASPASPQAILMRNLRPRPFQRANVCGVSGCAIWLPLVTEYGLAATCGYLTPCCGDTETDDQLVPTQLSWLACPIYVVNRARVAKLADAPDLGSGAARLRGSSPLSRMTTPSCHTTHLGAAP